MTLDQIQTGQQKSYACKFRTVTFLDDNGKPVQSRNLQPGQAHPGTPGEYVGLGIIQIRDTVNRRVQLIDVNTHTVHTVDYSACWDVDTAEIKD